ncbi:hypothetical protein C900_03310 [Fulvivirga imtechensis AK7]|uniref:Uncharacterized protein n=1 Tax=Fulvivirga imtechensis AK7 TaxID=1237149 RepID=L8JPW7_9BACT|nr:hypothetical protein C900_03310 [Fulvivirga imtechensis AK7]
MNTTTTTIAPQVKATDKKEDLINALFEKNRVKGNTKSPFCLGNCQTCEPF